MNTAIAISIIYGFGLIIALIGFLFYVKKLKKDSQQFDTFIKNNSSNKHELDLKIICK